MLRDFTHAGAGLRAFKSHGDFKADFENEKYKNAFHLEVYVSPKDDERQCDFRRSKGETLFTVPVPGSSLASKRSLRTMIMNDVNKGCLNSCLSQFFIALFITAKD